MSETVQAALDKANPNTISDNLRLARIGRTLADGSYWERVAVVANVAALAIPAKSILSCFASAAGAPGWMVPVINEAVPIAGQCAIDEEHLGLLLLDEGPQLGGIAGLGNHLDAGVGDHFTDARADQFHRADDRNFHWGGQGKSGREAPSEGGGVDRGRKHFFH